MNNLGPGCPARLARAVAEVRPSQDWLGRIFDGVGAPMDGEPPPSVGSQAYPLRASPPPASKRALVAERIDTGVTAINTFVTCCRGQRLGIFAGSGVGKTTLLGMLARNVNADAIVIALVGERGALQVPGLGSLVQRAMGWIRSKPAVLRAAWLGLLTPLLPCGLLWAACAGAAVAGSAWSGAQVMAGFALGSLPLLLLAQHQSLWLGRRFGPRTLALVQRGTMLVAAAILAWRGFAGLDGGCCH